MKSRNYTFLFVFVLFLIFLLSHPSATEETKCESRQTEDEIEQLIQMGSTVVPKDKMDKVVKRIYDDYSKLSDLFIDGNYKEMAKILGGRASLKIGDDEYIRGRGPIREYFKKQKGKGYQSVKFELVWAFISHEDRKPLLRKNSDNMVYENFKYCLLNESGGEIVKNQDGEGERSGRHTQGCDWIGN